MTRSAKRWSKPVDPLVAGCVVALVLRYPWMAIAPAMPDLARRYRKASWRRREQSRAEFDPLVVARVIHVGLAGGLPLPAALTLAVGEVGQLVAGELTATLRTARREGMSSAMATSTAPLMRPLFGRIALAQASGAPMHEAVAAYLADGRAARRGKALEQVRRLPVTLMVPLGLLILPGFVVLFVGPIVLNSLVDLSRSLP
jgi:tight adherence protein B